MASWKKIVTSGSNAELNHITSSGNFEITGNISGSATSTGSFGRVENASGKFRVLGTTAEISSPGLTQLHIFQDGLGTNSNAPSLKIGNNGQGNGYELTLSVGTSGQANFSGNVSSAGSLRGTQFDGVNSRGTAGTALFTATGNGGDGGGMYFGGGGAFDIRFSTTEKERLRIDTEGNGGGIQTSGSLRVGSLTAGATSDITATGNISGSATSTGSFGRVEATTFVGDGSGLTGLTSAAIETYNTSGDNRILTSVNSSTVQGEAGLTFDGSELRVQGDIVAENFIVSSSVTHMTQSFSSGSTIFGDGNDDTHQFTGSVFITGSTTVSERLTATEIGAFKAVGAIDFNNENMTNVDIDSGDIASGVTINKSPVVNFNSGDVQGSITLSNLATGTGGLTIQATSVQGTMLNDDVADDSTIEMSSNTLSVLKVPNALTAGTGIDAGGTFDGAAARTFNVNLSGLSSHTIGAGTSEITIGDNLTIAGNLTVQGDTVQQQVANLNVEDRFILLNSGSASGDGGIVVQTESADGDGVAFAYDDSESRWSFQQGTKLNASASAVAPDAYASAVVTSDDANYQKNGNIRVQGGEIYIYVE